MRYTVIKGVTDGIRIDLGSDTSIIGAVMEIGKAIDALTYEARLSGAELLNFLQNLPVKKEKIERINPQNEYLITACDW